MKELEKIKLAQKWLQMLANGEDPLAFADKDCKKEQLKRCFLFTADILGQILENGGRVVTLTNGKKLPFSLSTENSQTLSLSEEELPITKFVQKINEKIDQSQMKKLRVTQVTQWLLKRGYLVKVETPDGKAARIPSESGRILGISVQRRQRDSEEFCMNFYSKEAQKFILSHLREITSEETV